MKLTGLRVLDLSQFLPGPHLTMTMADHGADVVMIEPANGVGEPSRELGLRTKDGIAVWFRNISRGKKSLKLDLKSEADLVFLVPHDEADVVIPAFRPGRRKAPRHRLRDGRRAQSAHRLLRDHRLRPGRTLSRPARA